MGKVRTDKVKKVARELVKRFPDRFNTDFANNKKILHEVATIPTPRLRNRIAGYVTRLVAIAQASAETKEDQESSGEEKEEAD